MTVDDISRLVAEAPQNDKDVFDEDWQQTSFCAQLLNTADDIEKDAQAAHDYEMLSRYWLRSFPGLAPKTRTSITATLSGITDILLHGDVWKLLATETNIIPEVTFTKGAIILVDLPISEYGETGRIVAGIWKLMFQRCLLRRDVSKHPRMVGLFCDESQNFCSSMDYRYQAECRKAKAVSVYATQNIDNYYAVLGGKTETDALLGNFMTKIFHANNGNTNTYASDLISTERTTQSSVSASLATSGEGFGGSTSISEIDRVKVLPSEFMTLLKGGDHNNKIVQGYVVQSGRVFQATNETYILANFTQGS